MIGIFDSGVGGLSVFREIRRLLPDEKYVYYSDNANCPYGEKTTEYIIERARSITDFLLSKGSDVIVIACNTATAASIASLREEYPYIPFIGMEPAIKPAAKLTSTGVVGVLATAGTLKAEKYIDTRCKWAEGIKVTEHIGQGFVELVEQGKISGPEAEETIRESIAPLLDDGADTIVLGCTHYPFLTDTIIKVAGELYPERMIRIVDSAPAVARHLKEVMEKEGLIKNEGFRISMFSSGNDSCLKSIYNDLV